MNDSHNRSIRISLTVMLTVAIAWSQWPFANRSSAAAIGINLKTASQISSEATSYDNAIRELSAISLSTVANLKGTQDILEAQVPKLKFGRTKLLSIALSDSAFIGSLKAKVFDQQSAEKLALELAQEKEAIYKLSGASAVRDRIKAAVSADVEKLQRLAKLFKENEAALRKKEGTGGTGADVTRAVAVISAVAIVVVVIAAAMIAAPALTAAVVALAAGAAVVGVSAAAAATVAAAAAAIVSGAATSAGAAAEQAQDKVAACVDKADSKNKKCKSDAYNLFGPAIGIALEKCKADWAWELGACLVLD